MQARMPIIDGPPPASLQVQLPSRHETTAELSFVLDTHQNRH